MTDAEEKSVAQSGLTGNALTMGVAVLKMLDIIYGPQPLHGMAAGAIVQAIGSSVQDLIALETKTLIQRRLESSAFAFMDLGPTYKAPDKPSYEIVADVLKIEAALLIDPQAEPMGPDILAVAQVLAGQVAGRCGPCNAMPGGASAITREDWFAGQALVANAINDAVQKVLEQLHKIEIEVPHYSDSALWAYTTAQYMEQERVTYLEEKAAGAGMGASEQ